MVCITMTKPMARRSRWSFSPSRSEVWRIQGRRACYGPLWPAPYLKPKEIFSTPAFQPSPTSKEQGNCRASASLALPALHPALLALPPQLRSTPIPETLPVARPSSTRPARPSSAVAPPLVLSPSARVVPPPIPNMEDNNVPRFGRSRKGGRNNITQDHYFIGITNKFIGITLYSNCISRITFNILTLMFHY